MVLFSKIRYNYIYEYSFIQKVFLGDKSKKLGFNQEKDLRFKTTAGIRRRQSDKLGLESIFQKGLA
jgi:hypothetical protein